MTCCWALSSVALSQVVTSVLQQPVSLPASAVVRLLSVYSTYKKRRLLNSLPFMVLLRRTVLSLTLLILVLGQKHLAFVIIGGSCQNPGTWKLAWSEPSNNCGFFNA